MLAFIGFFLLLKVHYAQQKISSMTEKVHIGTNYVKSKYPESKSAVEGAIHKQLSRVYDATMYIPNKAYQITGNWYISIQAMVYAHLKVGFDTAQKTKFSINGFFSKCNQIHRKLRIWPHLLKKFMMENLTFCTVRNSKQTFCRMTRGVFKAMSDIYDMTYCENSYKRLFAFSIFSQKSSIIGNGNP